MKEYRPEQIRLVNALREYFSKQDVYQEYRVNNLMVEGTKVPHCVLDVAVMIPGKQKIAIRINGEYHFASEKQRSKDYWQRMALEEKGWKVLDFDKHYMEWMWEDINSKEIIEKLRHDWSELFRL